MPTEDINVILDFNKKLHDLVEAKLQIDIKGANNKDFLMAFAIGKAFKTYEALGILCRSGYGEDAFMLARTLLELLVTTLYILQDETEDRLIRYMSYDWVTRKKMYDYIVTKDELLTSLNKEIESGNMESTLTEVEEAYEEVMKKYKYKNGWSDKSIKGMSEEIGRLDLYNTVFSLQCTLGHTNARSMNEYMNFSEEGTIFNVGANWKSVKTTLVVAFDLFFHLTKKASNQFNWKIEDQLDELAKIYGEEVGKIKYDTNE